jgi:hypothetical protein
LTRLHFEPDSRAEGGKAGVTFSTVTPVPVLTGITDDSAQDGDGTGRAYLIAAAGGSTPEEQAEGWPIRPIRHVAHLDHLFPVLDLRVERYVKVDLIAPGIDPRLYRQDSEESFGGSGVVQFSLHFDGTRPDPDHVGHPITSVLRS